MKSQFTTKFGKRRNMNIILTEEMYQALAKLAAQHSRTVGYVIRIAVADYLAKHGIAMSERIAGDELLQPITVGGTTEPEPQQQPPRRRRTAPATT